MANSYLTSTTLLARWRFTICVCPFQPSWVAYSYSPQTTSLYDQPLRISLFPSPELPLIYWAVIVLIGDTLQAARDSSLSLPPSTPYSSVFPIPLVSHHFVGRAAPLHSLVFSTCGHSF
jgi:hypothetical protein